MDRAERQGVTAALIAAAIFGATAPVAKQLLEHSGIAALSFLLYLGGFVALSVAARLRGPSSEAGLRRGDVPALAAISLIGGIAGPLLLLVGLRRTSGIAGSLLLNLEAPLTLLLALALFGEHLSRRMVLAAATVFVGAGFVTVDPGPSYATVAGATAIAGACVAWALDNNLTQRLALRDPVRLVQVKAGAAAVGLGTISVATGSRFPTWSYAALAAAVGAVGYGLSIVLDVRALRLIGAARESALFATAPLVEAVVAMPLLAERPTAGIVAASVLMGVGVAAFIRESHEHRHVHEPLDHEHFHEHDEHHRHDHPDAAPAEHSHAHHHDPTAHAHPHASDAHHRHSH